MDDSISSPSGFKASPCDPELLNQPERFLPAENSRHPFVNVLFSADGASNGIY